MQAYIHLNEILTLQSAHSKNGRMLDLGDLSLIKDGAVVFDKNVIHWIGKTSELPQKYNEIKTHDLSGHVLTPEIVDSHTHLVFGGDRAQEYADRLNGRSYEDIAKNGGGILFTMHETQSLNSEQLFKLSCERVERIFSYGVGTIEIKSGYGLSFEKEMELSLIIHRLKMHFSPKIQIFNTYLAAHDVPKSFIDSEQYMDEVVMPLLEKLASLKIIDAVDIFHEKNYFSSQDVSKLLNKAKELNLARKIHADELNDNKGAGLAVEFEALSADHLLQISSDGIGQLANSNTVATLLPGTAFFLGKALAPARAILDRGAKVAIASDYNPGSCHCDNLLLISALCAAQMKLKQVELWAGITLNAAHALGLKNQGALVQGLKPRFSLFKTETLSHITYHWGRNFAVIQP